MISDTVLTTLFRVWRGGARKVREVLEGTYDIPVFNAAIDGGHPVVSFLLRRGCNFVTPGILQNQELHAFLVLSFHNINTTIS